MPAAKKTRTTITKTAARESPKAPSRKPSSKHSAKSSRSGTMKVSESQGVANQATYNKLIKKGMSHKQAAAFSRNAGGASKGGKSSKPVTKKVTRRGKK